MFHHGCSSVMGTAAAAEEPSGRPLPVPVGGAAGAAAEAEAAAEKSSGRPLPIGGGFGTADDEDAALGVLNAGGRTGASTKKDTGPAVDEDAALGVLKAGGRTGASVKKDTGGAFGAAAAADLETSRILLRWAAREPASGRPPPLGTAAASTNRREGLHTDGGSPGGFGAGILTKPSCGSASKKKAQALEPEWLRKR